jgi:hypothetical protein
MKVRVLKTFRGYKKGQVFDNWADGMARIFVARGVVEEVRDIEAAAVDQPAERAALDDKPRRRKG